MNIDNACFSRICYIFKISVFSKVIIQCAVNLGIQTLFENAKVSAPSLHALQPSATNTV